jgi:hypothetical protein
MSESNSSFNFTSSNGQLSLEYLLSESNNTSLTLADKWIVHPEVGQSYL